MTEWNTTFEVMVAKSKCMEKVKEILTMFISFFIVNFLTQTTFILVQVTSKILHLSIQSKTYLKPSPKSFIEFSWKIVLAILVVTAFSC